MRRISERTLSLLLCAMLSGPGPRADEAREGLSSTEPPRQWSLPPALEEISGLALTADGRLLAIDDEVAVVHEIDPDGGRLVKRFALGRYALRGDFEGIAVLEGRIWLMTSSGELYVSAEGEDAEHLGFERHVPDLGDPCELEALATLRQRGSLLLGCKKPRPVLLEWRPGDTGARRRIELPERKMARDVPGRRIKPTGIDIDPTNGDLLLLAADQRAVFRLSPDGAYRGVERRLERELHPQAEGIAVTADGRLLVADEGAGGRARLSVYPPADGPR